MAHYRFGLFTVLLTTLFAQAQRSSMSSQTAVATYPSKASYEQVLSWLPSDTETVIGVTGPIVLPAMSHIQNGMMTLEKTTDEVTDTFKQYSLLQLLTLSDNFKDHPIVVAVEGSRDFRPPAGLGMAPYQGAAVAVFADDITANASAFLKDSASTIVQTEQIEGQPAAVFKQKSEEDIWTTYVAFPKPNIAVVATNEDYLREVLARINGKHGERALPDSLPEWKYVNTQAQFWAMRHFRNDGEKTSMTSGFSCIMPEMKPDKLAIGLAFNFDPEKSSTATIIYLSEDENTLQTIQKSLFNIREQGVSEMHAQYREVDHRTLEGTYNVKQLESAEYFILMLENLLGHAIFI